MTTQGYTNSTLPRSTIIEPIGFVSIDSKDGQGRDTNSLRYPNIANANRINFLGTKSIEMSLCIPNVNVNNNKLTIETASQSFQIEMPPGLYTSAEVETFISTELNLLGIGLFTVAIIAHPTISNLNVMTIQNLATPFKIVPTPGQPSDLSDLFGLSKMQPLANDSIGGCIDMRYSPYYDIVSLDLNKYDGKSDYSTDNKNNDILARLYAESETQTLYQKEYHHIKWVNMDNTATLGNITIRVVDQNGLEVPISSAFGEGQLKYSILMMYS